MPNLIQSLDKVLYTIKLINENRDIEAIESLGLRVNQNRNLQGSFLERAIQLSSTLHESNFHSGGILVTPDSKTIDMRDLLSESMNINYMLTEDIGVLTANSISSFTTLTEGVDAIIDYNGFSNIKNTLTEGLSLIESATLNTFNSNARIAKKVINLLNESCSNPKYSNLIANALISSNTLVNIKKAKEFASLNSTPLQESANTINVRYDPDSILFGILDLQENLINSYIDSNKFNNLLYTRLTENRNISDVSEYISGVVNQVAIPISENSIELRSDNMIYSYNNAINTIASLYDEYIQDYVN